MEIKGTATRVLTQDDSTAPGEPGRVFFTCNRPDDLRKVDGSKRSAVGEVIAVVGEDAARFKVGADVVYSVETGRLAVARGDVNTSSSPTGPFGGPDPRQNQGDGGGAA
jgi:hypothetical protein